MNWIKEHKSLIVIGSIIFVALIIIMAKKNNTNRSLAGCIKNSGAKFYGSKTCPHCISQKKAFGDSAIDLPYVECTSESGSKICEKENIKAFPTWIFADGTRQEGELSLDVLASKTKCTNKK